MRKSLSIDYHNSGAIRAILASSIAAEGGIMRDWKLCCAAAFGLAVLASSAGAATEAAMPTIETSAQYAYAIDFNTGAVMLDKAGEERIQPASLSKMMTAYVVFEYLKKGQAKLDDTLPVSVKAWEKHKTGESNMFVPLGGRVKIEDLIRGMIIQSGNDACVVLAEGLAGSTDAFVAQMNATAQKLGLAHTHFADVDGLPDPEEYTTAHDLAMLARHLIADFPERYHYEAEKEFTYNNIKQGNRNPLLYKDLGVDGIKTGHTEEAGYSLAASALRDGRRVIVILAGMHSMQERADEGAKVVDWTYRAFNDYTVLKAGDRVDDAPVWLGEETKVPATSSKDVIVTLPRADRSALKVTAVYDGEVKAPVAKGETVGKLMIAAPTMATMEVPLIAAEPVARLNPLGRIAAAAGYFLWGRH
jgi:serine-type D-Ala-D-Ala carboxypeptidase (penicillin-binding protein 5/6)